MRILMIEDDTALVRGVCFNLKNEGYEVDYCYDGEEGYVLIQNKSYDLILLDCMLPHVDGLTILKRIRMLQINIPIIMVTALSGVSDRVSGLKAGADDYIVKPFAMEELIARIEAVRRRPRELVNPNKLEFEDITLDLTGLSLTGPSHSCSLSKTECALAEFMFTHPQVPLTREQLIAKVWGPYTEVEDGNLDNYIHFLRRRLTTVGSRLHIKTIRSVGYLLEVTP